MKLLRIGMTIFCGMLLMACSDLPTRSTPADLTVNKELVDPAERRPPDAINAHVYGTFALRFGGDGPSVITSGPANFPGNPPAGPGTCDNGLWINPAGKPTRGDSETPHPHCVSSSSSVTVVLEPISAFYSGFSDQRFDYWQLLFGHDKAAIQITQTLEQSREGELVSVQGTGVVLAYAIDAATLGTTNRRVGTLLIDLKYYSGFARLFDSGCTVDGTVTACLNQVVTAVYKPFADGVGVPTSVTGFLWFTPSTSPYNY